MSDHGGHDSGHAESKIDVKSLGEKIMYGAGVVIIVLLLSSRLSSCSHEQPPPPQHATSDGTQKTSTDSAGTCAPFSADGTTCEIGPEGSGWIRVASNTPAGLHFCWTPNAASGKLKEVWELGSDGEKKLWSPDSQSSDIQAYMFVPNEPVTLSYNLAKTCTK